MFIDTHTHLFLEQFNKDRDEVIERAINNNVKKFILPNVSIQTIEPLINLSKKYPKNCFSLIGLHPSEIKDDFEKDLKIIQDYLSKYKFYGIGEIGIDLYWETKHKDIQEKAFEYQINMAKKNNLPIIIHARKSYNEIFRILDKNNDDSLRGIFHCFSGSMNQAEKIINYEGFKLGIGGVLTYKNSKLGEVVKNIDLKHIVLETDSPFLPPVPKRGKRNESSYLLYIAEKLSEEKEISLQEVENQTTINAEEIFGKLL